jgi:hypothetical protein
VPGGRAERARGGGLGRVTGRVLGGGKWAAARGS